MIMIKNNFTKCNTILSTVRLSSSAIQELCHATKCSGPGTGAVTETDNKIGGDVNDA